MLYRKYGTLGAVPWSRILAGPCYVQHECGRLRLLRSAVSMMEASFHMFYILCVTIALGHFFAVPD
jgi:hypothetical protein